MIVTSIEQLPTLLPEHAMSLQAKRDDAVRDVVIEPLSRATETQLEPMKQLSKSDFLLIDLDHEGTRFVAQLKCLVPYDDKKMPSWAKRRVLPDGRDMMDGFWDPSMSAQSFFKRLPERRFDHRSRKWTIAGTDYNSILIASCWPQDKVVWLSEAARNMHEFLLARFASQMNLAQAAAEFKVNKIVPRWNIDRDGVWRERADLPLSPYQRAATELCIDSEAYALFMDMGTGKTPIVIQRICVEARKRRKKDKDEEGMMRVLVVCPPQVRLNWSREFARFATTPGKTIVVRGGQAKRVKQLTHGVTAEDDCEFGTVIISYDSLVSSIDHFCLVPWDLVVADESHWFKDPNTLRFGAMRKLREYSERRMILTGSPIGNTPMDLWSQLEFLGNGLSGFMNWKNFKQFFGRWEQSSRGQIGVERLIGMRNIPLLQERLTRISFAVTKKEAGLGLPDKVRDVHEVQMTKKQADIYDQVVRQLALEITDKMTGDVNQMTISNVLTQLLRLSQITSGHVVWDEVRHPFTGQVMREKRTEKINPLDQNPKVEAIVGMLRDPERDPKSKTIVWCTWVPSIKVLSQRLTQLSIKHGAYYGATPQDKRQEYVDAFNGDPEFRVLVANPQTAGEGLNLIGYDVERPDESDTFCDHVVFFSNDWSAIKRRQAEDRAHRRGARMPVRITDLVVPGTIDEDILDRLNAKQQMATIVADVSAILRSVLNMEL